MTDVNIYFIRHGFSCSNLLEYTEKLKFLSKTIIKDKKYKDPHLTNWGIFSSILVGKYLESNGLENIKFDHIYCSPLLRTWETSACMFADKYDIAEVAPFLREKSKIERDIKVKESSLWNIPYTFKENQNRFVNFKDFLDPLSIFLKDDKKIKFYKKQVNSIKKFKIESKKYNKNFIDRGDLISFIEWYLAQNKNHKNIAVICHGVLIREFIKNNYKIDKQIKKNNFCVKYNTSTKNISIIFEGVKLPNIKNIQKIENTLSLCSTDSAIFTNEINSINI